MKVEHRKRPHHAHKKHATGEITENEAWLSSWVQGSSNSASGKGGSAALSHGPSKDSEHRWEGSHWEPRTPATLTFHGRGAGATTFTSFSGHRPILLEVQPFREPRNANFQCLKARFTAVFPQRFPKGLQCCPRGPVIPGQGSPRTAVISGVPRPHPLHQWWSVHLPALLAAGNTAEETRSLP